jgi:flagellar basal-body rod modification protein FlgD
MSSSVNSITTTEAKAAANQTLTQTDYLQLLTTQMSSQDPLNPQSDTAFAAQLAQFSALQESQAMQQNMAALQANTMIGETVTITPSDGSASVTGEVTGVQISSGTPTIIVNGNSYSLSNVTSISPTTSSSSTNSSNSTQTSNK